MRFRYWEIPLLRRLREIRTTKPFIVWVPTSEDFTFFDLRKLVAEKFNLLYRNINIAHGPSLPITDGQLEFGGGLQPGPSLQPSTQEDIEQLKLAAKENRDSREFKFNVERSVPVSSVITTPLRVICIENLLNPNT